MLGFGILFSGLSLLPTLGPATILSTHSARFAHVLGSQNPSICDRWRQNTPNCSWPQPNEAWKDALVYDNIAPCRTPEQIIHKQRNPHVVRTPDHLKNTCLKRALEIPLPEQFCKKMADGEKNEHKRFVVGTVVIPREREEH